MHRTALTQLLLDMACAPDRPGEAAGGARTRDLAERTRALDEADWRTLADCAAQHRLQPILHDRCGDDPAVPAWLRDDWRSSTRFWTMKAAAARVDLHETVALLDAAGFAPLALKGAFLAWHAYPRPALRPLRDIDVLVPAARVTDAFALLREHGWQVAGQTPGTAGAAADIAAHAQAGGKHLTPLVARCGTLIELHHRLWEREGELDHRSPASDHDAVRARAITRDGIAYPCPEDMLAHLIVHAVYSHRLDCGPLLLWDIRWLAGAWPIDWGTLRARASQERWEPGLDLIIALSRRYLGTDAIADLPEPACVPAAEPVPARLVEAAADLLLQDLDTRRSAGIAATAMVRGLGAVAARVTRGASARLDRRGAARSAGTGTGTGPDAQGLRAWTGNRLRRTVGELADPAVRDQARDLSRLSKWLGA